MDTSHNFDIMEDKDQNYFGSKRQTNNTGSLIVQIDSKDHTYESVPDKMRHSTGEMVGSC